MRLLSRRYSMLLSLRSMKASDRLGAPFSFEERKGSQKEHAVGLSMATRPRNSIRVDSLLLDALHQNIQTPVLI